VHRGVLVKSLAASVAPPRREVDGAAAAASRVRRSLLCGAALAARAGARGALLLQLAWQLAPGFGGEPTIWAGLPPASLPPTVAQTLADCAAWHRSCGRAMAPPQLSALPFVVLLLMDAPRCGLDGFERLVKGPLGLLGAAVLLCRAAPPLLRALLAGAGRRHALRGRGGDEWAWAFWLGLSSLMDQWVSDRWEVYQGMPRARELRSARQFVASVVADCASATKKPLQSVPTPQLCAHCWTWGFEGEEWCESFYCTGVLPG
ncbi:unnamed protein product, partial [Prorocentrum cordatum]